MGGTGEVHRTQMSAAVQAHQKELDMLISAREVIIRNIVVLRMGRTLYNYPQAIELPSACSNQGWGCTHPGEEGKGCAW